MENVAIVEDETDRAVNECGRKTVVLLLKLVFFLGYVFLFS